MYILRKKLEQIQHQNELLKANNYKLKINAQYKNIILKQLNEEIDLLHCINNIGTNSNAPFAAKSNDNKNTNNNNHCFNNKSNDINNNIGINSDINKNDDCVLLWGKKYYGKPYKYLQLYQNISKLSNSNDLLLKQLLKIYLLKQHKKKIKETRYSYRTIYEPFAKDCVLKSNFRYMYDLIIDKIEYKNLTKQTIVIKDGDKPYTFKNISYSLPSCSSENCVFVFVHLKMIFDYQSNAMYLSSPPYINPNQSIQNANNILEDVDIEMIEMIENNIQNGVSIGTKTIDLSNDDSEDDDDTLSIDKDIKIKMEKKC